MSLLRKIRYFRWLQLDSNSEPLSWLANTQPFGQTKNDWVVFWVLICTVHLTVCSYVKYAFQSESTFYSYLNVKELLARSRPEISSLSDYNWTRTQNHLVGKPLGSHRTDKYSEHSSIIWPVWPNGWVFVY